MIEKIVKINGISRNSNDPIMEFGEELIRCRECRFWPELIWNAVSLDLNEMHTSYVRCFRMGPDDFCSKAKKRGKNAE